MSIKVRYNGLEIDGNLLPLFSAAFPYWRSHRDDWPLVFDQIKGLGFQVVETRVPWSLHETAEGDFDFGKLDPSKDLDAWLGLAHQKGLKVVLRPGPGAEGEDAPGWPARILSDPGHAALDAEGAPVSLAHASGAFTLPSGADEGLLQDFDVFLAALAPLVQKHLHPHGAVVALQVGHEQGRSAAGAYALDYSPASLKLWAHFLDLKYRQMSALNRAWGSKHKTFEEASAPRAAVPAAAGSEGLRAGLDWVEYGEYRIQWTLGRLSELYRARGLGAVPLVHNFPGPWMTPFNIGDIESDAGIDVCGLDSSPDAQGCLGAVDQARYLVSSSRLAYFPEYGVGKETVAEDQACVLLAPLMGGIRGLNFVRAVGDTPDAPLDAQGGRREEAAPLFERFNAFLRETEWSKAAPLNQGLLLRFREVQQREAALGRAGEGSAFYEAARGFCAGQHFSFSIADGGMAPERLARHAFVVATSADCLDESVARRLLAYIEAGGSLVLGPSLPSFNARFEPLKAWEGKSFEAGKAQSLGDGRLLWLKSFDTALVAAFLRKAKIFAETELSDPSLELAAHKSGGRLLLFVRNPHAEERRAKVLREGKFVLKPLWASGKFLGAVEERDVVLAPREIKVWEIIPA